MSRKKRKNPGGGWPPGSSGSRLQELQTRLKEAARITRAAPARKAPHDAEHCTLCGRPFAHLEFIAYGDVDGGPHAAGECCHHRLRIARHGSIYLLKEKVGL